MTAYTHTILRMKESSKRSLSVKQTDSWQTSSLMFLTTDGAVRLDMEGIRYELNAKDSVLIRSGIDVMVQSLSSEQVVIYTVTFDQFTLAQDAQNELVYKVNHDNLPDNGEVVKGSAVLFLTSNKYRRAKSYKNRQNGWKKSCSFSANNPSHTTKKCIIRLT